MRGRGVQIVLLCSVSNYAPRMRITTLPRDDGSFILKSYIACGTTACMNWTPERLQQIRVMVYIPIDMYIYTVLDADPDTNLLGPF